MNSESIGTFMPGIASKGLAVFCEEDWKQLKKEGSIILEPIVISVDHGNKLIKVDSLVKGVYPGGIHFNAGYEESLSKPGMAEELLKYKDRYYMLSSGRFDYQRDKTENERYFVLTLFAIGKELEALALPNDNPEPYPVVLLTFLPPGHMGSLKEKFARYFSKGNQTILFSYNNHTYRIQMKEVCVYPQGYAAAITKLADIKSISRSIIVEMGGYTTELIQMLDGRPDPSVIHSMEIGTIHLYNKIRNAINRDFNLALEENDIDAVLLGKKSVLPENAKGRIGELARNFTKETLGLLREQKIDLRTAVPIFAGGGFLLLRKYLREMETASPIFIDSITANCEGGRLLYEAQKNRDKK